MSHKQTAGHLAAAFTVIIWGTTFISTKLLLAEFSPIEILFFRFLMGLAALFAADPHGMKETTREQEITFAAAGLCGVCLYYLLENVALTLTMASNVGVIISIAPLFTAIASRFFMKQEERLHAGFFAGLVVSMAGIFLISFNGTSMNLNPAGDLLAILAAMVWALYSILTKRIGGYGYPTVQTTRRIFEYGLIFMLPALLFFDFSWDFTRFRNPVYLFNILYLGLGASALCFVTWNLAVKLLGAVKTSVYIYMDPAITVIASALILKEKITAMAAAGTVLTLTGLFLSESFYAFSRTEPGGGAERNGRKSS